MFRRELALLLHCLKVNSYKLILIRIILVVLSFIEKNVISAKEGSQTTASVLFPIVVTSFMWGLKSKEAVFPFLVFIIPMMD